jgi:hypothetical protein
MNPKVTTAAKGHAEATEQSVSWHTRLEPDREEFVFWLDKLVSFPSALLNKVPILGALIEPRYAAVQVRSLNPEVRARFRLADEAYRCSLSPVS